MIPSSSYKITLVKGTFTQNRIKRVWTHLYASDHDKMHNCYMLNA